MIQLPVLWGLWGALYFPRATKAPLTDFDNNAPRPSHAWRLREAIGDPKKVSRRLKIAETLCPSLYVGKM